MDPILFQKQIRDNNEESQQFANSLQNWEQEMKNKEAELIQLKSQESIAPEEENVSTNEEEQILKHEEADCHKNKGNEFVKKGKWKEALEEYSTSILLYPNDAVYYGNRSYCHVQLNNWEEAENDCNHALELKPDYVKVALRRANVRRKRGNIQGAAKDYNLVLVLEPKNVAALKEYEEIYPELKQFYSNLGIKLPEFVEMNPSSKPVQDDEPKHGNAPGTTQKKGFKLVYSTGDLVNNKESVAKKSTTPQSNQKKEKIADYSIIYPEQHKLPHLRSKLPLRRIQIVDVYLNSSDDELALLP